MSKNVTFTCPCCGKTHNEWPALAYVAPVHYHNLSEEQKRQQATLSEDFCVIRYPEETGRFVRCTLTQKVIDHCFNLEYGLWCSLSEKSYTDYSEHFGDEDHEASYFGWLSNDITGYSFEKSIPTMVKTRTGGQRPEIIPDPNFDHPFVRDYYNGISLEEAEKRIEAILDKAKSS
jgi:hypothetical protein